MASHIHIFGDHSCCGIVVDLVCIESGYRIDHELFDDHSCCGIVIDLVRIESGHRIDHELFGIGRFFGSHRLRVARQDRFGTHASMSS
jgi:hypothetical protein